MNLHEFSWKRGGKQVFVTGTLWNWKEFIELLCDSDTGIFHVVVQVPMEYVNSKIYYKYIVDSQWLIDPDMPQEIDECGNINNVFVYTPENKSFYHNDSKEFITVEDSSIMHHRDDFVDDSKEYSIHQNPRDFSEKISDVTEFASGTKVIDLQTEKQDIESQENKEKILVDASKKSLFCTDNALNSNMISIKQAFQDPISETRSFGKNIESMLNLENMNSNIEASGNSMNRIENVWHPSIKKSPTSMSSVTENITFFFRNSNCDVSDLVNIDDVSSFSKQTNHQTDHKPLLNTTQKPQILQDIANCIKSSEIEIKEESQSLFNNELQNKQLLLKVNDMQKILSPIEQGVFSCDIDKNFGDVFKKTDQNSQFSKNDDENTECFKENKQCPLLSAKNATQNIQCIDNGQQETELFINNTDNVSKSLDNKFISSNDIDQKTCEYDTSIVARTEFSFLNMLSSAHQTFKTIISSSGICGDTYTLNDDILVDEQDNAFNTCNLNNERSSGNDFLSEHINDIQNSLTSQNKSIEIPKISIKRRFLSKFKRFFL